MEGNIAEIRMFAGNFVPRNWAFCDGQLLAISSNTALFSIIGTMYGGDGRTTFALPDLRGRVAMHAGNGPGLTPRRIAQRFGSETTTISTLNLPAHSHQATINARREQGTGFNPSGGVLAADPSASIYSTAAPDVQMSSAAITVSSTGNQQPFNNIQPTEVVNYIICMFGIFPSRS